MRKKDDATLRVWVFSAVAFFALIILYFLGPRLFSPLAGGRREPPPAPPTVPAERAVSPLPTSAIRMKIKRIEPRKYRREGELPPPPSVR